MKSRISLSLVLGVVFFIQNASAQIIGDYRTNGAGTSWTNAANWDRWSGLAWVANVSYPGQAIAIPLTTVTIQNTHNMILDVSPANNIVNLIIGGGASGSLTIGNSAAGRTLTCSGAVTVSAGASLLSGSGGGSHTLTFQSSLSNSGTINFSNDQITLSVSGATTNSGALTFGTNTGVKTFIGAVTNTGTWTSTALSTTGNLVFRAGVSSNGGTFSAGGATFNDVASNAQSIGGTAAMSFSGIVTLSDGAIIGALVVTNSNTNASGVSITGTAAAQLTGTAGAIWRQGANSALLYAGSTITTITLDASTNTPNTVNYNSSGAQTIFVPSGSNYSNLIVSNTSTASIGSSINVTGALTLNNSGILSYSANCTVAVTGSLTMDGTSQIVGSASSTTRILTAGSFSVPVSATNARIGSAATTDNPVVTINGASSIVGTFSTLNDGSRTFVGTVTNSGSWTSTSNTTTGNMIFRAGISNSGTFSAGGATFNDVASNAQSIGGTAAISFSGVVTLSDGATAGALVVTNSNTNANGVSITGTAAAQLTGTAGAIWRQGANSTFQYAGSTITTITLDASTNTPNTVNYNSSGAQTIFVPSGSNYSNLIVSNTSTASIGSSINVTGALTLNNSGILSYSANCTVAVTGSLTMDGTSQIVGSASSTTRILTAGSFSVPVSATNARMGSAATTNNPVVTINGASSIVGTFSTLNDGSRTFIGTVTNSGSWTSTSNTTTGNMIFRSGISNSGTFSAGGATFNDVTSNAQSIGGTAAISFSGVVTLSDGATAGALVVTNSNTNASGVSITGTGAAQLTGTAGAIWRQGANSTLQYAGSTITTITLDATTNTPNTVNYTGATPTIYAVNYNNLTYSGTTTGSITSSSISGNLTCSSGTFTSSGTITFNGSSTQTVSGAGALTFTNITMSTGSSANVAVNNSITASGTISWTADGLIVVGSNGNVTLGTGAVITSPTTVRYIQLDGTSGTNSNLIRTTTNAVTQWQFTFPVGTATGGYTPLTIPTITTAPANNSTLSVKPIVTSDLTGRLKRSFRLTVVGNANATTFSNGAFSYSDVTDISSGDAETDYTTGWLLISGGTWGIDAGTVNTVANTFTITGGTAATASLATGTYYYTCGSTVNAQHTWYSYQTGNYSDFNTWTIDPSGTTFDNALNIYPAIGDEIHILNGFTVTVDIAAQTLSATTIDGGGILDLSTTTGHNLGVITGTGLLRTKSSTLPTGTYTDFVTTTGGTIEYYDVSGNLSTSQTTYNILKLTNSTASNITFTEISNLTVNGTFSLTTTGAGTVTWQINDASNNQRTIVLNGDLNVASGGRITVGTGNEGVLASGVTGTPEHLLSIYGNFTNNGIVQFYDATDTELPVANYGLTTAPSNNIYTNGLQGNAVTVTFTGTTDNTITCNNTTDFYRLELNKGTGTQAVLTVNSSSTSNFRLFGPTNQGSSGFGTAPNEYSANALSIINGTLQLTGSINIPNLDLSSGNDYFSIPQNGALWLNGASVTVTVSDYNAANNFLTKRLMVNGLLRITAGTLDAGISAGIGAQDGGTYLQEGGTVKCWQFRPRASGSGIFAFEMTGGTLNVGYGYSVDQGYDNTSYARFDLNLSGSTFQMTGGTMNIAKPVQTSGIFNVVSSAGNYSVTGGTINLYSGYVSGTTEYTGYVNSTAPLYNVSIFRESGSTTNAQLQNLDLTVQNNLTIDNSSGTQTPSFLLSSGTDRNLTVGGSFNIQSGTTFTPGTTSTVTFNGTGAQTWTHNGTITRLVNLVINKTSGTTLTLAGANTFPNITGAISTGLTITSGTLADAGKTLTVDGLISNSGTHSGAGKIIVTAATTIGGNNGTFGNLRITTNGTVATSGNQTVSGNLELNGAASCILNIASNNLTVGGTITTTGAFGTSYYIRTSGLHNAGGVTRQGSAGDLLFPVGNATLYTPNTINVTATTHGTTTVRPVNSEHPNVTTANLSLKYYWRVTSSGYSAITAVTHKTYTFSTATKSGTVANYHVARFDASALSWNTSTATNVAPATVIQNFNTGTSWTIAVSDQLDGEYTCGETGAFGGVTTYYSKTNNGLWNVASTWTFSSTHSGADASPAIPCATCPVIIGDGAAINHTIIIDANSRSCGTLTISTGSTLDCSTFTSLNFGTNTGGFVSGNGTLRVAASAFPAGDFTNFIGSSGGTVEWYGTTKTIPSTGPAPQNLTLSTYYNLIVNPTAANTITLPANNLTVYNNWTQTSGTGTVTNNGARTLAITGNLTVSSGTFSLTNSGNTTLTVGGSVSNSGTFSTTGGTHTLTVTGGITNNNVINFNNTGTVALTLTGSSNVSFTGTGTGGTTLSTLIINKGSSQTPTVTFDVGGTITTATGFLTLTNGTINFNGAGTNTFNLSATSYTIPSTAKLKVSSSTVTVNTTSGDADANDLFLNGALEVAGGTVNVGNNTVNTNSVDIEYAAAGSPAITVSSGTLWVKASVRRSTSTLTGALAYTQTGGTVTIGGISATDNSTRGVFEIDANTGSSFTLTGTSSLTVQRQNQAAGNTGYADLFINPITSNVSSTSTITVGLNVSGTTQSNLRVNIAPSIGNFSVGSGGAANAQTVKMYSNPMVLAGTLTIPTPSVLTTNSLDVSIAGDLSCTGTYTGGTNVTTFNGTGAQAAALSSTSTFNDLTISKTAGTTVTLSGTSPSLNNLNILTGILDVGSLALNVTKNITINSSQVGAGSVVVYSSGFSNTITSSGGSFTNLTLGGTSLNKTVNVSGSLTINGVLNFSVPIRYFMIASNQLTFGTSASITGASSTNGYIRTNGVASDLGVTKNWATGTNTFKYEVGTSTNYTPVSFSLNVTVAGTLNVVPVNSAHLTVNQASSEQILNYYWTVNRGGTLAATKTANVTFNYPSTLITGTGGTLDAAYLDDSNPSGWITSGHGGTATTTQMDFTVAPSTNIPLAGFAYDYSVGTPNTLPNPIVPLYSRLGVANVANPNTGGNWNTASNWTTDSDGDLDLNNPSSVVPTGVPVVILSGARINMNSNGRKAFKTTINGLLDNSTSKTGHNLGVIDGTGTFRTATNTFPAGTYTSFVSAAGGTIEYIAPMTMNNRTTYHNLSIYSLSAGTVSMTASNLTLTGNVTIPTGTTLDNSSNNANMSVAGNWTNNDTFIPGTGTVSFTGSSAQTVTGSTSFNNLTMAATANTTLAGTNTTTVNGVLTMTTGKIISSATHPIAISATGSISGGSSSSYISGPMTAVIGGSSSFNFPLGNVTANYYRPASLANTSGADTWTAEYVAQDPTLGGYPSASFNPASFVKVSGFEYWLISRTAATSADLTLSYDVGSYLPGVGVGLLSGLYIAHWDSNNSQWDLPAGGGSVTRPGSTTAGTVTVTNVTSFSPTTFGSTDGASGLPIVLLSFTGEVKKYGVELQWSTSSEINNSYFTVLHSSTGSEYNSIGTVKGNGTTNIQHDYTLLDKNPVIGKNYYRLMQTDFDGHFTKSEAIMVNVLSLDPLVLIYPNPLLRNQQQNLNVEINGLNANTPTEIQILNIQGIAVQQTVVNTDANGSLKATISPTHLNAGLYILNVHGEHYKIIVE